MHAWSHYLGIRSTSNDTIRSFAAFSVVLIGPRERGHGTMGTTLRAASYNITCITYRGLR